MLYALHVMYVPGFGKTVSTRRPHGRGCDCPRAPLYRKASQCGWQINSSICAPQTADNKKISSVFLPVWNKPISAHLLRYSYLHGDILNAYSLELPATVRRGEAAGETTGEVRSGGWEANELGSSSRRKKTCRFILPLLTNQYNSSALCKCSKILSILCMLERKGKERNFCVVFCRQMATMRLNASIEVILWTGNPCVCVGCWCEREVARGDETEHLNDDVSIRFLK